MSINLLPANTRLKIRFRSMLRRFVRIWAIAGLGALLCVALQVRECWQAGRRLADLEARCAPLDALQRQIQDDRRKLDALEAHCKLLAGLQPADHCIDLLGVLAETTRAEPGKLHIQRLSVQTQPHAIVPASSRGAGPQGTPAAPATIAAGNSAAASAATSTLSLNGQAEDDAALTQFVSTLRQSGVFERVELKASSQATDGSKNARHYQLECRFEDSP